MPAKGPPKAPPEPPPRERWVSAFSDEIRRLRGIENWSSKFAAALAQAEYVQHRDEDPVKVAQAWASRQGPKR